jgi:hypothetical protein
MMLDRKNYVLGSAEHAILTMAHENSERLFAGITPVGEIRPEPQEIVMVFEDAIVVKASIMDDFGSRITEADDAGERLVRVANDQVKFVYTDHDTETYQRCVEADDDMIANAM